MAEQGRREVIPDQLAFNAREQAPDRSLATMGIRNPGADSGFKQQSGLAALKGLQAALGGVAESMAQDAQTEGKLLYMQGATEAQLEATGNRYTKQGYEALSSVDQANTWALQQEADLPNYASMDPQEYKQQIMKSRAEQLEALPNDPAVRKLYVAAWEDQGPALVAKQFELHNAYNENRQAAELGNALNSTSATSSDATRVMPGSSLRVSQARVDTAVMYNDADRDAGILTLLGEAGGEGDTGMAAVAHVIKNRVLDKRWGGSVESVVKAEKQFSTWNSGAGGNGPEKWRGTAAYERAAQVYDAVMQGYTVDPTNGATHYYSPEGMKDLVAGGSQKNLQPGWLAAETGRSGGGIKIGGHVFAGKSGMAGYLPVEERTKDANGELLPAPQIVGQSGVAGSLKFVHKGQENLDPGFAAILTETSAALGIPLTISSGYRDPNHPVEKAKKNGPGEHSHKGASDIDMTGMSDEQRKALLVDLRARGVKRFGTYSKSPDMLHVDMNTKKVSADDWFMFDRSNDNLGSAPAWFQQVAASETGKPTTRSAQTSVRGILTNAPGTPQMKARVLADTIRRQFDQGSNQLFNDVGGIGILHELGAKPQEIDEVIKAQERFEKKQTDGYNSDFEKERADLLAAVKEGKFNSREEVQAAVDVMYQGKRMNGQQAQSLVRTASEEFNKLSNDTEGLLPKPFMEAMAKVYRKVDTGLIGTDEAYEETLAIAKRNGVSDKKAVKFINKVYADAEAKEAADRNKLQAAQEKQAKDTDLKARAVSAVVSGQGKAGIPTGTVEHNGRQVSTELFAIDYLKGQIKENVNGLMQEGKIQPGNEERVMYNLLYPQLAKNDVIDKVGGDAFQASLRGGFVEKKDGKLKVNDDALTAFDVYMSLSDNAEVGESYVSQMFDDPKVRGLLEQAKRFYSLNLDLETSLIKASETLSNGGKPPEISTQYWESINPKIDKIIDETIGNGGWLGSYTDTVPYALADPLYNTSERNKVSAYVRARADTYNALTPTQDPEVSIKMAMQDFKNDAVTINGKMLIGDHKRGERVDQKMGLADFPKGSPQEAINGFLDAQGKDFWPEFYGKEPGVGINTHNWQQNMRKSVQVTYSAANSGLFGFEFHDSKGTPKGKTYYVSAEDIGKWYRTAKLDNPGAFAKTYDSFVDDIQDLDRKQGAANAGSMIGSMVKPK